MSHRDPVTRHVRDGVLWRDRMCVAAKLDPKHVCRDVWGRAHAATALEKMTLDHVQEGYGRMGVRAPSDPEHLVTLCYSSHVASGWATSHRPQLREYLRKQAARTPDDTKPNASEGTLS